MANLGLIGAGTAARIHGAVAGAARAAKIAAVGATDVGGAEPLAGELGVRPMRATTVPDAVDAVIVATPTATHRAVATDALARGCPVLVEAPLAWTLDDADAIITASTGTGVSACYAENLTAAPLVDAARAQIAGLGPLRHLGVEYRQPRPDWRHEDPPARALEELGPRAIALAVLLAGAHQPEGVRATVTHRDDTDDAAHVELRCAGELVVTVDVAWTEAAPTLGAQAADDHHALRLELLPEALLEADGAVSATAPDDATEGLGSLGYVAQLQGFATVVDGGGGRVCPAGFGRLVLELTHAAYASDAAGQRDAPLPYSGPRDVLPRDARLR